MIRAKRLFHFHRTYSHEKNLDKASKDGVHWGADASRLMADEIIKEIEKSLPEKHK